MTSPIKIENAPGLTWRRCKVGWEARWQCRNDIKNFEPRSQRIWAGAKPSFLEITFIQDRCNTLQNDMLVSGRGGIPTVSQFTGTLQSLICCYQHDKDSPYRKVRYRTRLHYDKLCERLERDMGDKLIEHLRARDLIHYHEEIQASGKIAMAHSLVAMLRILMRFGVTLLEDTECARVSMALSKLRFVMPKPRESVLTADMAIAIRAELRKAGHKSLALAQAIQFECMLRQRDVIGEWVPMEEAGMSEVLSRNQKWLRGIRWEEIDENFILVHITSKRQKELTVDLKAAPMVVEELGSLNRSDFPASGPVIVRESSQVPWSQSEFNTHWRKAAEAAGIPKGVRNMDSRAGAITEATDANIPLEHIKHAATHSDIAMTQRYARGAADKTALVLTGRVAHRTKNKPGT